MKMVSIFYFLVQVTNYSSIFTLDSKSNRCRSSRTSIFFRPINFLSVWKASFDLEWRVNAALFYVVTHESPVYACLLPPYYAWVGELLSFKLCLSILTKLFIFSRMIWRSRNSCLTSDYRVLVVWTWAWHVAHSGSTVFSAFVNITFAWWACLPSIVINGRLLIVFVYMLSL